MNLHELLKLIGDASLGRDERWRMLAQAKALYEPWAKAFLRRQFRDLAEAGFEETLLDHVESRVWTHSRRYRGENGLGSAMDWLRVVCLNKCLSERRRRQRAEAAAAAMAQAEQARIDEKTEYDDNLAFTREVVALVERALKERQPARAAVEFNRIRLGLNHVWLGNDSTEKLVELGYLRPEHRTDPARRKDAQDLAAQHRRRGRRQLSLQLKLLVDAGLLALEDALRFAALNKVPWPPPEKPRSKARDEGPEGDDALH